MFVMRLFPHVLRAGVADEVVVSLGAASLRFVDQDPIAALLRLQVERLSPAATHIIMHPTG